jgi:SAM-dependent methyltransferase
VSLRDDVRRWDVPGGVALWSSLTGRHVIVAPESLSPMAPPLEARLKRLGMLGDVDAARLVVVRSRWPLLRPQQSQLWHPVPSVRTAGGHAWTARPLSDEALRLWRAINDARTVADVAAKAGLSLPQALEILSGWTSPEVQAVQLRDAPPSPREPLWHLLATPREAGRRTSDQRGDHGQTTLTEWHLAIENGDRHFDDVETTVAHALGLPHPALRGRPYGLALREALLFRGPGFQPGRILEVGCGDGEMAASFTSDPVGPGFQPGLYVRCDLSPELLRTQAKRAPHTLGVLGDGARLPFRDASFDLVLSNEVIADLSAVPEGLAADRIDRYGLPRGDGAYNLGAWQLVEEIARVLKPGGSAFVSEFGSLDEAPEEAVQLDHPEVSIHFGHLLSVARQNGLEAEVVRLDDLLGVDLTARQLARPHHEGLRAMMRAEGRHLPARAWTPETLAATLPWPVEGLAWVPMSEPGAGPLVTRFYALLATKKP